MGSKLELKYIYEGREIFPLPILVLLAGLIITLTQDTLMGKKQILISYVQELIKI